MRWHVWHCVIISFKVPCFLYIFSLSLYKLLPLTFSSWFFPLKTTYFTAFCRQGSDHFDLFIPPCSITPCQLLRLMSKVMTDLHPRRLRQSGGLVRVASLIMVLISLDLASKYENFENFGAFCKFLVKLQVFSMSRPRRVRGRFWRTARNFANLEFLERACKEKNYQYSGEA